MVVCRVGSNTFELHCQYQYKYFQIKVLIIPIPILFIKSIGKFISGHLANGDSMAHIDIANECEVACCLSTGIFTPDLGPFEDQVHAYFDCEYLANGKRWANIMFFCYQE